MYRECPPPDALSSLVECFWWHEQAGPAAEPGGVILPDGRVDVIWTSDGGPLVAGPQERVVARPLATPFLAVGARFHPGVGPPLLGLSSGSCASSASSASSSATSRTASRGSPRRPGTPIRRT